MSAKPRRAGVFGKLPAREDPRTLRFGAYLTPSLPPPPERFNVLPRVEAVTKSTSISRIFPADGNIDHGDCTIAAVAHALTVWNALAGVKRIPSAASVLKAYFALTGGEDTGLYELNVLNAWRKDGLLSEKILAYVAVNPKNHDHVKQAINLFGLVYIGFTVQEGAVDDFRHHRPWEPGRLTREGHAVVLHAYGPNAVQALTWGGTQYGTWDWLDECCDEAYAILPGESTLQGFHPGFDYAALKEDLQALTV